MSSKDTTFIDKLYLIILLLLRYIWVYLLKAGSVIHPKKSFLNQCEQLFIFIYYIFSLRNLAKLEIVDYILHNLISKPNEVKKC